MMELEDKGVHDGHRSRMRSKFKEHGARIFDTYELVEMLLYSVIPMRDTNPVAKRLLSRFGGVTGMMLASREELCEVSGIGTRAADLISQLGRVRSLGEISGSARGGVSFSDYHVTGRFLTQYFKRESESSAIALLLDDTMRLLGVSEIKGVKFGTGGFKPKVFVDAALRFGATIAIVAYSHGGGVAFPFDSDIVTCKLVENELFAVGVTLAECYIVEGGNYSGVGPKRSLRSAPTDEIRNFENTRNMDREVGQGYEVESPLEYVEGKIVGSSAPSLVSECLANLLSAAGIPNSEESARLLASRYGSLDAVLCQSLERLTEIVGERTACLLRLSAAIVSQSMCEGFAFGRAHSDSEIVSYLIGAMYSLPNETVMLLSVDERGRVKCVDTLGEGTVNASDVYPRKIAECAVRRGASSVILAHNHPCGAAVQSNDDILATATLFATCRAAGVRLSKHIIIAGRDHCILEPDVVSGAVNVIGKIF